MAIINEATNANTIVKANGVNSSPTGPVTLAKGRYTATVTIVDERMG